MDHEFQDQVSLEIARRVAERLRASPAPLLVAQANLDRWSRQNADAPSLLGCYAEWRAILKRPVEDICATLLAETQEGRRLRQNSPFAGVLSPGEVWEIKSRLRHAAATA
ncbi:MAG: hypothetical protein KDM81_03410 [Verrucomicrobiae bacterium]|nr:hypothetical protein [Verrucomicrobiae bacterium]MCP5522637.1 hypothetical protein [Verrucomicrobiales bacterium]